MHWTIGRKASQIDRSVQKPSAASSGAASPPMNDLVSLHFERTDIRMTLREGEPWWVLIDVARFLAIKNHRNVAARLRDWQKDDVQILDAIGRMQRTLVINEPGLYSLILESGRPEADRFARWLFTEVLPSIRRFGCYPRPTIEPLTEDDEARNREKTLGQRFREERLRWEAESGQRLATLPSFSTAIIRAIEDEQGGIRKGNRIEMLTRVDIDVRYILSGERTFTLSERRMVGRLRAQPTPPTLPPLPIG